MQYTITKAILIISMAVLGCAMLLFPIMPSTPIIVAGAVAFVTLAISALYMSELDYQGYPSRRRRRSRYRSSIRPMQRTRGRG